MATMLGQHRGVIRYTIGQRKGLGLALPAPLYVKSVDIEKNTVTLSPESELFKKELTANGINLISVAEIKEPMHIKAKVRYRQPEQWATVTQTGPDSRRSSLTSRSAPSPAGSPSCCTTATAFWAAGRLIR